MRMHRSLRERFVEARTILSIAFRNLTRHKVATILLGGVIGFGVMVVSLLQGCSGAVMGNLSSNVANLMAGHIYVTGSEKLPSGREFEIIRDDAPLMDALQASGIDYSYVSHRSQFSATLVYESATSMQTIIGVEFGSETFLTERLELVDGSFEALKDEKAIIIPQKVAEALKVKAGYRIAVDLQTFSGQQSSGEFTVAAIVKESGSMSVSAMGAYANLDYVNKLLNMPPKSFQMLSFFIRDINKVDKDGNAYYAALKERVPVFERRKPGVGQAELMSRLRGEKAETWEGTRFRMTTITESLSGIKTVVDWISIGSLISLCVLMFVIAVGIFITFRMIMLDRIREIGTMRALGMQKAQVASLFLWEALLLSFMGAILGLLLALLLMGGISLINWGPEASMAPLLMNGHATFKIQPLLILGNVVIIGIITLLGALIPAVMAALLSPAAALRTAK